MRGMVYCVLCITTLGLIGGGLQCGLELCGFCISLIIGVGLVSDGDRDEVVYNYTYEHSGRYMKVYSVKMADEGPEAAHK